MNNEFCFLRSPADINMQIAHRMQKKRKANKLTQIQLAEKSGVSLGSVKRFERLGEISLSSLIKIAFILDCEDDFDALFSRKEYKSIQEVIDEQV